MLVDCTALPLVKLRDVDLSGLLLKTPVMSFFEAEGVFPPGQESMREMTNRWTVRELLPGDGFDVPGSWRRMTRWVVTGPTPCVVVLFWPGPGQREWNLTVSYQDLVVLDTSVAGVMGLSGRSRREPGECEGFAVQSPSTSWEPCRCPHCVERWPCPEGVVPGEVLEVNGPQGKWETTVKRVERGARPVIVVDGFHLRNVLDDTYIIHPSHSVWRRKPGRGTAVDVSERYERGEVV